MKSFQWAPRIGQLKETRNVACARAGGIQSLPKVNFPGGCLLGCSAGLLNVARIKGTHTAMKSGMLAAEAAFREITLGAEDAQTPLHMNGYSRMLQDSWITHELTQARFEILLLFWILASKVHFVTRACDALSLLDIE